MVCSLCESQRRLRAGPPRWSESFFFASSSLAASALLSLSLPRLMLFRARASSFLIGLGLGSGFALLQLRADLHESHRVLAEQVRRGGGRAGRAHRAHRCLPLSRAVLSPLLLARVQRARARARAPRRAVERARAGQRVARPRNRAPIRFFPARGSHALPPRPRSALALAPPARPDTAPHSLTTGVGDRAEAAASGAEGSCRAHVSGRWFFCARAGCLARPPPPLCARPRPPHGVRKIQPRSKGAAGGREVARAARGGAGKHGYSRIEPRARPFPTHTPPHTPHQVSTADSSLDRRLTALEAAAARLQE